MASSISPKIAKFANLVLLIGIMIAGVVAISILNHRQSTVGFTFGVNQEREMAIKKARAEGRSEYSFKTNFIPGIGSAPAVSDSAKD